MLDLFLPYETYFTAVLYAFQFYFVIFFTMFPANYLLLRPKGTRLKRGIKIWQEPLPTDVAAYLQQLSENVTVRTKLIFFSPITDFILKNESDVLVKGQAKNWGTFVPYIGYIDLERPQPRIEYRTSLPPLLFLSAFFILPPLAGAFVALILIGPLLAYSHYRERKAILHFLQEQAS